MARQEAKDSRNAVGSTAYQAVLRPWDRSAASLRIDRVGRKITQTEWWTHAGLFPHFQPHLRRRERPARTDGSTNQVDPDLGRPQDDSVIHGLASEPRCNHSRNMTGDTQQGQSDPRWRSRSANQQPLGEIRGIRKVDFPRFDPIAREYGERPGSCLFSRATSAATSLPSSIR